MRRFALTLCLLLLPSCLSLGKRERRYPAVVECEPYEVVVVFNVHGMHDITSKSWGAYVVAFDFLLFPVDAVLSTWNFFALPGDGYYVQGGYLGLVASWLPCITIYPNYSPTNIGIPQSLDAEDPIHLSRDCLEDPERLAAEFKNWVLRRGWTEEGWRYEWDGIMVLSPDMPASVPLQTMTRAIDSVRLVAPDNESVAPCSERTRGGHERTSTKSER